MSAHRLFWIAFLISTVTANAGTYAPRGLALRLFSVSFVAFIGMVACMKRIAAAKAARATGAGETR